MSVTSPAGGTHDPGGEGGQGRERGRTGRPRNYLAGAERHRLLWRVGPPALVLLLVCGWIEKTWLQPQPDPPPAQVDTVLARLPAEPAVGDAVRIATTEAGPGGDGGAGMSPPTDRHPRGASAAALGRVRDDTLFRSDDEPAWSDLCASLAAFPAWPPDRGLVRPVSYADLHGQSRALRGQLVGFRGILRRLVAVEPNPARDGPQPRWQGWIEPDGGPPTPIVVYFLDVPADMPRGLDTTETVDVSGYFFKRWAYQATDAVRTAPLVLSRSPRWSPRRQAEPGGHRWGGWGIGAITGLMLVTWVGLHLAARAPRARPRDATPAWDGIDVPDRRPIRFPGDDGPEPGEPDAGGREP